MMKIVAMSDLPAKYSQLSYKQREAVRNAYVRLQGGKCWHCGEPLDAKPPARIRELSIRWELFPTGFLNHPVHLQHNHTSDNTEGAVHARCNAVLWQYFGR